MKNFLFFTLFNVALVFAQTDSKKTESGDYRINAVGKFNPGSSGGWLPAGYMDTTIQGSPYLFDNWDGLFVIESKQNAKFKIHNLNYNITRRTLESKVSKDSVYQFDAVNINNFKRGNDKYAFFNVNNEEQLCHVVYASDKVTLIKAFKLEITKQQVNPMTQEVLVKSKYVRKESYLIKNQNNPFREIGLKKNAILKFMGDKSKQVEQFASDSKLSFNSEKDLFSIFQYYNTL